MSFYIYRTSLEDLEMQIFECLHHENKLSSIRKQLNLDEQRNNFVIFKIFVLRSAYKDWDPFTTRPTQYLLIIISLRSISLTIKSLALRPFHIPKAFVKFSLHPEPINGGALVVKYFVSNIFRVLFKKIVIPKYFVVNQPHTIKTLVYIGQINHLKPFLEHI